MQYTHSSNFHMVLELFEFSYIFFFSLCFPFRDFSMSLKVIQWADNFWYNHHWWVSSLLFALWRESKCNFGCSASSHWQLSYLGKVYVEDVRCEDKVRVHWWMPFIDSCNGENSSVSSSLGNMQQHGCILDVELCFSRDSC